MHAGWPLLLLLSCDRAPAYTALPLGEPERVDGLAPVELGGVPALVVATTHPTELRWFTSVDASAAGAIAVAASGPLLSPGDLDQDGYSDLVLAEETTRVTLLVFGGGDQLDAEPLVRIETHRSTNPEYMAPFRDAWTSGDVDGDGVPNVLYGWGDRVWWIDGVESEAEDSVQVPGWGGQTLAGAGDVDGDGYVDVVVGKEYHCGVLLLYGGPGGLDLGACAPGVHVGNPDPCRGPGDLDDDGFADVLCAHEWDYVPTLALHRGSPTGFVEPTPWVTFLEDVAPPSVARRDADYGGDGLADLVIGWADADVTQGGVLVYAGGTSEVHLAIPGEWAGRRLGEELVADLDLDQDGRPDIVTTAAQPEEGTEEVRVYRGADLW